MRRKGSGCGGFKWPLEPERAALVRPDKPSLANGGALALNVATALELAAARRGRPAEAAGTGAQGGPVLRRPFHACRAGEAGRLQGHDLVAGAGSTSLDGETYLHPKAFTGATGCEGARKSVKFDLPPRPLVLQFSGVEGDRISVIVSPDP